MNLKRLRWWQGPEPEPTEAEISKLPRQQVFRRMLSAKFAEITRQWGGEPRRRRRSMALDLARRLIRQAKGLPETGGHR
jgi:hypothetical protein